MLLLKSHHEEKKITHTLNTNQNAHNRQRKNIQELMHQISLFYSLAQKSHLSIITVMIHPVVSYYYLVALCIVQVGCVSKNVHFDIFWHGFCATISISAATRHYGINFVKQSQAKKFPWNCINTVQGWAKS